MHCIVNILLKNKNVIIKFISRSCDASYSKPIIGPNTSAIPEVVKNNVNGLLVNPGDINGYSNAMDKLINDHIRKTLSKNSYKILREQFNFKTMIDKINSTYNSEQT